MDGESGKGAGARSLAGFDYQVEVSIWLALDLVLRARLTQAVVLEPASEEDLEAELGEFEPGRINTAVEIEGYKLVVQAKLRSGDAWTPSDIKRLLTHGVRRVSAAERLQGPNVRYLLVTSAGLNGDARDLRVLRAGVWPTVELPALLKPVLPDSALGRLGVIAMADEERVRGWIKTLLIESFRVPNAQFDACRAELTSEANVRLRGAGGGRWTRADLEGLIRRHQGYIASSPELDLYVPPLNWGELVAAMHQKSAALIIGQSGTGKTLATHKLYEELRQTIPGLQRVVITMGPGEISADQTPTPVLYDIEDPWGGIDFDPRRRPWNDQLARFFSQAKHDYMFVATSRLDVAEASGALKTVTPWLVKLESEHYSPTQRRALYQNRIAALPRELQPLARAQQQTVLNELATPLEIQKFFDALPTIDEAERRNPPAFVAKAIRRAHQTSIEHTVVQQIQEREDVRAAAIVYGLLKANGKLPLQTLRTLEEKLADLDTSLEEGAERLVSFFVAARNLRQVEASVTYYHPRVERGIEQALKAERIIARRTLRTLIEALVAPDSADQDWGVGTSVRLLTALRADVDVKPAVSAPVQTLLDAWVERDLLSGPADFDDKLERAAAAGSTASKPAEIARYLLNRPDRDFPGFSVWGAPGHDDAWYERMAADDNIAEILDTFVRHELPRVRDDYREEFVADVKRIAPNLTPAFLAAAAKIVHYGVINTSDAIAEGALDDIAGFEAVVDEAVRVLTPSEKEKAENATIALAFENGEYSEGYAEQMANDDDGYTASEFLEAYVRRVRKTIGWSAIAQHRHLDRLMYYWFRALSEAEQPDQTELVGAMDAGFGSGNEAEMWGAIAQTWRPNFRDAALKRLRDGHEDANVRRAALSYVMEHAPEEVAAVAQGFAAAAMASRLVELSMDLSSVRFRRCRADSARYVEAADTTTALLPSGACGIVAALNALEEEGAVVLDADARSLIESVTDPTLAIRTVRLMLDAHAPVAFGDDVICLLADGDADGAAAAIKAAVRHDMKDIIEAALGHKFARVVAPALQAYATPLPAPLPQRLLDLSSAAGSPVRAALTAVLTDKPHPAHVETLVGLARDEWSNTSVYHNEQENYPIAQAAVAALETIGTIDEASADQLYRTALATRDPSVRGAIFELLARNASGDYQIALFDIAASPGGPDVRLAAAQALLVARTVVAPSLIERIDAPLLARLTHRVATRVLLLLAAIGDPGAVVKKLTPLATSQKRRVFLLLAIWVLKDYDAVAAQALAAMLPPGHEGAHWALADAKTQLKEHALDDLGEPEAVEAVLHFMAPPPKKPAKANPFLKKT